MKREPPRKPVGDLTYWCGGKVDENSITLRIIGDELNPDTISGLLGCQPTRGQRKGDILPDKRFHRTAKFGLWCLKIDRTSEHTLQEQIKVLFSKLPDDLSIWQHITTTAHAELFCGLWLKTWNREFDISPDLLMQIAQRNLTLRFDIYFEGEEDKHAGYDTGRILC